MSFFPSKYLASYRFFSAIERDPEEIIFDLCRGKTNGARMKSAVNHCKAFFESYVKHAMKLYPTLGTKEYEWKRMITSASTVLSLWSLIIGYANSTCLQKKRSDDHDNAEMWKLVFDTTGRRSDGPAYVVTLVRSHPPQLPATKLTLRLRAGLTARLTAVDKARPCR